jgi:hypothetical protein
MAKVETSSVHMNSAEKMNTKGANGGDGLEEWGVNKILQIPQ